MRREKITVLIPTFNCATSVKDTLESAKWADEIVVIDSYSTDETLNICRKYGARIFQHEFMGYSKQKNWVIPQCRHEWVLHLDSDEYLEPGLREEIEMKINENADSIHAFRVPRKNHVLGNFWLRYGRIYPDYQTRLFRRDMGRFDEREVHEKLIVPGEVGTLKNHIMHFGMPSISKQLRNLNKYTRLEANEKFKADKKFHWYHIVLRPPVVFMYRYFYKQGFRDGYRGFIVAVYLTIYDFLTHAKLWEMEELNLERSPEE